MASCMPVLNSAVIVSSNACLSTAVFVPLRTKIIPKMKCTGEKVRVYVFHFPNCSAVLLEQARSTHSARLIVNSC